MMDGCKEGIYLSLRKVITLLWAVVFCLLALPGIGDAKKAAPQVTADAVLVLDNANGKVLYEKNADKREYPASLTKVMTAILVLEDNHNDREVQVSPYAGDTPYSTFAYTGQVVRQFDMLTQMLLLSDNVAAVALAEAVAGNEGNFVRMMNNRARELGAVSTHFVNPHGLTDFNHYTTARDVGLISRYAMQKPLFRRIVGSKEIYVNSIYPQGETLLCENTNDLVYNYDGCIGIKTGWTKAAKGCLVAAARRNNHEVMVVLMHSDSLESRFTESAQLLDYGFDLLSGH